jgi:hypothetical protein
MQTFTTIPRPQMSWGRCKVARWAAALLLLTPSLAADPWSESLGLSPRLAALRAPSARTRAAAAWWIHQHPDAPSAPGQDVRAELRAVIAHERDAAAAVAEVAAMARLTRGTHERAVRLGEVLTNGLVPPVAQRVALRALTAELTEDQLPEFLARVGAVGSLDAPLTRLAARGLAALPTPLLSAALQQSQGQPARRATVVLALGMRGDPRWAFAVLEALDAPRGVAHERLTAAAVEATASLRLVEAAPRLVALAEDERAPGLRAHAVRALGMLGGSFDPTVLTRAMREPLTRVAALEAAAALGDRALGAACAESLDAPFARDRAAAVRCVAALTPSPRSRLSALDAREEDPAVRDALRAALPPALPAVDPRGTEALAQALSHAATASAGVRLANLLSARAGEGDDLARDVLLALARREQDLPSPTAIAALSGAVRAGATPDDEVLLRWLGADDPAARQCALHAAGVAGAHAARAVMREVALREVDDDARQAAAVALGRAGGARADELLRALDETAFSEAQMAAVAQGRRLAGADEPLRAPFTSPISLQRSGFAPGSVWAVTLPDGGLAVGAADDEGVLLIPSGGAAVHGLRRLDAR